MCKNRVEEIWIAGSVLHKINVNTCIFLGERMVYIKQEHNQNNRSWYQENAQAAYKISLTWP